MSTLKTPQKEPVLFSSPWLNLEQAAAYAGVSQSTISRWAELGKIKKHKTIREGFTKGITRFKTTELDALLQGETK